MVQVKMKKFLATLLIVIILLNPFVIRANESSSNEYVTVGGVIYFIDENGELVPIPGQQTETGGVDDDDDDPAIDKPLIPQDMR